jgi:uncharacterized protein YkwD
VGGAGPSGTAQRRHAGPSAGLNRTKFSEALASDDSDRHSVPVKRPLWFSLLLGLACLAPGVLTTGAAEAVPAPARTGTRSTAMSLTADQFESRLLARTNYRRLARGCRPIRLNAALVLAARRHSAAMADQSLLSHRLAGEGDLAARAEAAGYVNWRILAENLAWGQASPREVFRAWVRSPGHRENLDNCRLRDVGFGVVYQGGRPWVSADFGRRF